MGLVERAKNLWLNIRLATEYVSAWSNNDHLANIVLEDFLGFTSEYVRVNRGYAMKVSAIAAGRNTIAGTTGRLPLYAERGGARLPQPQQPALLVQPEVGTPIATTMTWTCEDLLFHPVAWWHIVERDFYRWPVKVRRVAPEDAKTDTAGRLIGYGDVEVKPEDVIRFDSPLGAGLLIDADRTIRRAVAIELAAALAEDNPVPTVELHNEGADINQEKIDTLLDAWSSARRKRGVAYTPKGIKAIAHGAHVAQLLIDGRKAINLDLIRAMNLPAWAASTAIEGATMTYDNRNLRNWELIDLTLAVYFAAIGGRLSLNDVTPRGWSVKVDPDDLTRPDMKTRFETYRIGLGTDKTPGFITQDYINAQEGWAVTAPGGKP